MGASPPIAEKWVFIRRSLIHRVGGENIEIIIFLELLDKAKRKIKSALKFQML